MINKNEMNSELTQPVLKSLYSLRKKILDYDPNKNISAYEILQELLTFRRNWRDLSTFLEEKDNKINEKLVKNIREKELCYYEYEERRRCLNFLTKKVQDNIYPAFEMYVKNKMSRGNNLEEFSTSVNDSFKKIYNILDKDLVERKRKKRELESKITEHSKLVDELKQINQNIEELNKQFDPIKNNLDSLNSYLSNKEIKETGCFSIKIMMQLSNILKPIYIYFCCVLDRILVINKDENTMNILVNAQDELNIIINRPFMNFLQNLNSQVYIDFLEFLFPIKLQYRKIDTLSSQEVVSLFFYNKKDKMFECDIFSNILFQEDYGKNIPLIDSKNTNISSNESCGKPYFWLQYLVNNNQLIPTDITNIKVHKEEILRVIEKRIDNFLFFSFLMHVISSSPESICELIGYHCNNEVNFKKNVNFNLEFDLTKIDEINEYHFNIQTEDISVKVLINLTGNISYYISENDTFIQEKYICNGNEFDIKHILNYNENLIVNFCNRIYSIISG